MFAYLFVILEIKLFGRSKDFEQANKWGTGQKGAVTDMNKYTKE